MTSAANAILQDWNCLDQETAAQVILPCNGSRQWAARMARQAPFDSPSQLFHASDEIWLALEKQDWQQAFHSHPRIGEHHAKAATARSRTWSAEEQGQVGTDEEATAALEQGNRMYEARFHRTFIVCATGKTAADILAMLQTRLQNDDGAELQEAAEQQRQITQLRLRRWLQLPLETR